MAESSLSPKRIFAADLIPWDGCFYGNLAVFVAGTNEEA